MRSLYEKSVTNVGKRKNIYGRQSCTGVSRIDILSLTIRMEIHSLLSSEMPVMLALPDSP
jgi:hypothetical protein